MSLMLMVAFGIGDGMLWKLGDEAVFWDEGPRTLRKQRPCHHVDLEASFSFRPPLISIYLWIQTGVISYDTMVGTGCDDSVDITMKIMTFIVPRASARPTAHMTIGFATTSSDHRSGEKGNEIMETHVAINQI